MKYLKLSLWVVFVIFSFALTLTAQAFTFNWWSANTSATTTQAVPKPTISTKTTLAPVSLSGSNKRLKKFSSANDFLSYIKKLEKLSGASGFGAGEVALKAVNAPTGDAAATTNAATPQSSGSTERFSSTNVQVAGIDEPDIIKTDGENIYFSPEPRYSWTSRSYKCFAPGCPPAESGNNGALTGIFGAKNPSSVSLLSKIGDAGDLILSGKTLIVQSSNQISAYGVSDPAKARPLWTISLTNESPTYTRIVSSRLSGGKYYLITASNINRRVPCPITIFKRGAVAEQVRCADIYYPTSPVIADSTYTISRINPLTGVVEKKTSFVAPSYATTVYMSPTSLYIAYTYEVDQTDFAIKFIKSQGRDFYPADVISKLDKLASYDISRNAKSAELYSIVDGYHQTLSEDDRLTLIQNLSNRLNSYVKLHTEELQTTEIGRFSLSTLLPVAGGSVPGHLLNQFSLDEYNGYLRVAATNQGDMWLPGGISARGQSSSAVYVLSSSLATVGSVGGLGNTEQIYGVRFIGNRGYVVTFRQVDPFYVLDLASPRAPRLAGELKIPGYSGYLHPLANNRVLGVGMENGKVKLAIYDVSNASAPQEISKFVLDDYWSEAVNNHRAFMIDEDYQVFFIPAGQGGYVFSYAGNNLTLKKAISGYEVKRALYVGDYLFILSRQKMSVISEKTWEKVREIDFDLGGNNLVTPAISID